eukprot:gene8463-10240_t
MSNISPKLKEISESHKQAVNSYAASNTTANPKPVTSTADSGFVSPARHRASLPGSNRASQFLSPMNRRHSSHSTNAIRRR